MMKQTFPKVWFSTENRVHSQTRFVNRGDHGSLYIEAGELQFMGRKQSLKIKNIKSVDLVSSRIPWISIAFSTMVLLVCVGLILSQVPSDMILQISLMVLLYLSAFIPFMIFAQKAILWVEITFVDDENVLRRVYFLDGSRLNLNLVGGLIDDTLKMYKELRSIQSSAG